MSVFTDLWKRLKTIPVAVKVAMPVAVIGTAIWAIWSGVFSSPTSPDPAQIATGRAVYQQNCASCHGDNLQGQPEWKDTGPDGRYPAPPHDASGHTWHHPDGMLLRIIGEGSEKYIGGGYQSDMPGFDDVLTADEISAVLNFIKNTWPERERNYQATLSQQEKDAGK